MIPSQQILPSEEVRSLLREHGLRVTRQRETLYTALAATTSHPTADELFAYVSDQQAGLSLATVYTSREACVDAGLCQRIHAGSATRYDASNGAHAHVQTKDGRVLAVTAALSRQNQRALDRDDLKKIEDELGVSIASISFGVSEH